MRRLNSRARTGVSRRRRPRGARRPRRSAAGRRLRLVLMAVLAFGLFAGGSYWLWHSGRAVRFAETVGSTIVGATAELGFTVQKVYCEGRRETSRDDVLAALRVERGQPIIEFDPKTARERLESLGWVYSATVQRHLPDTVHVTIVERRAMARWQNKGATYLVDREGVVIGPADSKRYAELPLIVGEGAPQAAPTLFDATAAEPELFQRIEAGVWVSGRRWNLYLDNDVEIFLPEEGIEQAWSRLAELDRRHGLLGKAVSAIDLRLEDRLVLRLTPPPPDTDDEAGRRI